MTGPRRIDGREWQRRFLELPEEKLRECRYFRHLGDRGWNRYLKPPSAFYPYGLRRLKRLTFDDDLRALRLWAFALEEPERLFRARQAGLRVVGLMGDYGAVAPLVFGFPDLTAFYPDFAYWSPFFGESDVLLERADRRGLGEDTCFVRAAVGAFTTGAHWPKPDLIAASSGASCDDLAAVTQLAFDAGNEMAFLDIPLRKSPAPWLIETGFETDADLPDGTPPRETGLVERLTRTYRHFLDRAEGILGPLPPARLADSVERSRRIRGKIGEVRRLVASAPLCPLPAAEELVLEFAATHSYGDPEECEAVVDGVLDLVRERAAAGVGFGCADDLRIVWVNPPPDPLLHVYAESRGARIVGTEYLIASALTLLPEDEPCRAVARSFLAGSLLGDSETRADAVAREVERTRADGVIVSNLFGSSHCGAETPVVRRRIEERCGLPVLTFDVPKPVPGGLGSQVRNRLDAYLEGIARRSRS